MGRHGRPSGVTGVAWRARAQGGGGKNNGIRNRAFSGDVPETEPERPSKLKGGFIA